MRFAVRLNNKYASLAELARSPVRSSAVPRSAMDGKKSMSVGSPHQSGSQPPCVLMVFVAADVIHSLSRPISELEIYPTVLEFYRSLSTLTSALSRQTIRRFGNHCHWFQ